MPSTVDVFHDIPLGELRGIAVTYYPNRGASRMNRADLASLLLDSLADEEADGLRRAVRCPLEECDSVEHLFAPLHRRMSARFGRLFSAYKTSTRRYSDVRLSPFLSGESGMNQANPHTEQNQNSSEPEQEWPQPVPQGLKHKCMADFKEHTTIEVQATCSVCARRIFSRDLLFNDHLKHVKVLAETIDLSLLKRTDPHLLQRPRHHFQYGHPSLDNLILERSGVHIEDDAAWLDMCDGCLSSLKKAPPQLPSLALANGLLRGYLPEYLQDLTWLEERLCAKYLASAYVIRLYDFGAPDERSRTMKGHACSFPLNTVSTAVKLPWVLDGGALVSCIVIGPRKPTINDLRGVFKVRKEKVRAMLLYLREHFKGYPQFPIDERALDALPADDVPELIARSVIYQHHEKVPSLFDAETTGLEAHPAFAAGSSGDLVDDAEVSGRTFLEHHGMMDVNGVAVPAHLRTGAALSNATGTERPDLIIRHGSAFVQDYNNPELFPGMFPTLYPWGLGGFEGPRTITVSFARHAKYLLDLAEPAFRRHWSFVFVVANIKQRRAVHLGSRLVCNARDHARFTQVLASINKDTIAKVAEHLSQGGDFQALGPEERSIHDVLRKCQLVSANVPGSKAVMDRARADIRAYVGQFGIFQLFLTLNPGATHSPVFQIFYGDTSIKLDTARPPLPSSKTRAIRVADDPVASSDYFHFHIYAAFRYLLGWDIRKGESTTEGGIFGRLAAFVIVKEHTMRGHLHCHSLIWLQGGLNPSALHQKMKADTDFRDRYLTFFDDLISHHGSSNDATSAASTAASGTAVPVSAALPKAAESRKARQERPPCPSEPNFDAVFAEDHRLLVEEVQRHRCTFTCFKGGRDSCRFLFPHDLNKVSNFDPSTNSVNLRVLDPTVNWHNATLLVALRHNLDLKLVLSGKSGVAAASYITAYATKSEETPANQVSMIRTTYERMAQTNLSTSDAQSLLTRCVMQFGRERQVHAQQAATYVRELGDVMQSHTTVPMMSGQLIAAVIKRFGPVRADESTNDTAAISPPQGAPSLANAADSDHGAVQEDEDLLEDSTMLPLSKHGMAHQVDDYMHRGPTLSSLSFYDFVAHVRIIRLPRKPNKNHHRLRDSHPNAQLYCHRYTPGQRCGIPRAICSHFPKRAGGHHGGDAYCSAILAHFVPFGVDVALKSADETWEDAFARMELTAQARSIMANWDALTECEDARDAEQLLRRKREAFRSARTDADLAQMQTEDSAGDNPNADVDMEALLVNRAKQSAETAAFTSVLARSGWFDITELPSQAGLSRSQASASPSGELAAPTQAPSSPSQSSASPAKDPQAPPRVAATLSQSYPQISHPKFSRANRQSWAKEQALLEAQAKANKAAPRASHGILASQLIFETSTSHASTEHADEQNFTGPVPPLPTERRHYTDATPDELIRALIHERRLTPSQALAFTIAARRFFEEINGVPCSPLRLLMHGEAGTGKTVVVRLLRELMDRYGRGAEIMFLAPTGKAASAIGGMTQHAAFNIDIQRRGLTQEELQGFGTRNTGKRLQFLQRTFSSIRWIFFDEVSMTSCEVLAQIDQALRVGTQRLDDPFGGINVLFAGDLCQLPPVASAPLYARGASSALNAETRTLVELGRTAWLHVDEVVEFTEQMRMQDEDMAAALRRLRVRACTDADAALFNTNVLRSSNIQCGTTVTGKSDIIVLARTNETVRALNRHKASIQASTDRQDLVISHAIDKISAPTSAEVRDTLLSFNCTAQSRAGMGRLPLFVGMPVIFRGNNQSIGLGITNGTFGTVVGWDVVRDRWGYTIPVGAVVQFDPQASWSLSGLPNGSLPVYPTTSTFSFALSDQAGGATKVSRRQLPLQPGFAMTTHSAQGITTKAGVIVDLRRGGFEGYVAASRATRRELVFLIQPITKEQLNHPSLPTSLTEELDRLRVLAGNTKAKYDNQCWVLAPGTDTNCSERRPSKRRRHV